MQIGAVPPPPDRRWGGRSKLEQAEGGGDTLAMWVGLGLGIPLLCASLGLLVRNIWLAERLKVAEAGTPQGGAGGANEQRV